MSPSPASGRGGKQRQGAPPCAPTPLSHPVGEGLGVRAKQHAPTHTEPSPPMSPSPARGERGIVVYGAVVYAYGNAVYAHGAVVYAYDGFVYAYTEASYTYPKSSDTYPKPSDTYPKLSDTYPKSSDTYPKCRIPIRSRRIPIQSCRIPIRSRRIVRSLDGLFPSPTSWQWSYTNRASKVLYLPPSFRFPPLREGNRERRARSVPPAYRGNLREWGVLVYPYFCELWSSDWYNFAIRSLEFPPPIRRGAKTPPPTPRTPSPATRPTRPTLSAKPTRACAPIIPPIGYNPPP
jgi:hypothetical protein